MLNVAAFAALMWWPNRHYNYGKGRWNDGYSGTSPNRRRPPDEAERTEEGYDIRALTCPHRYTEADTGICLTCGTQTDSPHSGSSAPQCTCPPEWKVYLAHDPLHCKLVPPPGKVL